MATEHTIESGPTTPRSPDEAAGATDRPPTLRRTILAGVAGGLAFVAGTFVTFALFGGSREGDTGLLFDPDTQHEKVIAVWKEIEPLPRIIDEPATVLTGMVVFGVAYALLYRWVSAAWPSRARARVARLGLVVWLGTVFAEFIGPFNTMHQPLRLSVLAWCFWAVPAFTQALAIVGVSGRGQVEPPSA